MKVLVTGGAGFIGSAVIRHILLNTDCEVVNLDKLTYAANLSALEGAEENPRYAFERVDIVDQEAVRRVFEQHKPDCVMHLAAESHVDRSIDGPSAFIQTNLVGTYSLLEAARRYWQSLESPARENFRFHHISTDEVFGSLGETGLFTEATPYQPNSPYSASKAGSDHLVRAWGETYGLPVVTSNCTNNYGPWQFPEKLIPVVILNGLDKKPIPVYGKGDNIRDWLHVEDHADALWTVLTRGQVGETYNIGGNCEMKNLDLVKALCACLDRLRPDPEMPKREALIAMVTDRPGHDQRYAMDISKIDEQLGWSPKFDLAQGLEQTVKWYLDHEAWWRGVHENVYDGSRLGSKS